MKYRDPLLTYANLRGRHRRVVRDLYEALCPPVERKTPADYQRETECMNTALEQWDWIRRAPQRLRNHPMAKLFAPIIVMAEW